MMLRSVFCRTCILVIAWGLLPTIAHAGKVMCDSITQNNMTNHDDVSKQHKTDSFSPFEGGEPISAINRLSFDADEVHDTLPIDYFIIEDIVFSGNRKTRPEILFRELLFAVGDSLTGQQLDKQVSVGKQNLMNTQLFNFVEKEIDFSRQPFVVVRYTFIERWYTWPIPILELNERNLNEWIKRPSFSRVNYGLSVAVGNFSGRNEQFMVHLQAGHKHKYSLSYQSAYFNKEQSLAWGIEGGIERSREQAYLTEENQQLFYKSSSFIFRKNYGMVHMVYRPEVFGRHRIFLGLQQYGFADTLKLLNPRFVPGERSWFSYLNAGYEYVHDKRDAKAYPLRGHYLSLSASRLGMGWLKREKMDATMLKASYKTFKELYPRWFLASALLFKWSDGSTMSYFNQQGLGFANHLVRGYEDYVVDGQSYLVMKTSGKYELLPKKITNLHFIGSNKFSRIHYALYLNAFLDAGYAYDRYFFDNNPLNNKFLVGGGFGVDFVTYYDKVFRTEFSVNRHGEYGVSFHLLAPF